MEIIVAMVLGGLVGAFVLPERILRLNSLLQLISTTLLIFSMGVMLGSRDQFLAELEKLAAQEEAIEAAEAEQAEAEQSEKES